MITDPDRFDELVDSLYDKTQLMHMIWHNMPLIACVADTDGHIVACNPAMESALQRSSGEISKMKFIEELVAPHDRERTAAAYELAKPAPDGDQWSDPDGTFINDWIAQDGSFVQFVWLVGSPLAEWKGRDVYLNLAKIRTDGSTAVQS